MLVVLFALALGLAPLLFRLAAALRLAVPLLYMLAVLVLFHDWYLAYTALADGVFLALLCLSALSWIVSLVRRVLSFVEDWREDRAALALFVLRMREARARGESAVSTDGLWR